MKIYCTGCEQEVDARLTNGEERYPHRPYLFQIPFWKCDTCGNYVGCHWKTNQPTKPLGCIATKEIVEARKKIHAIIDPMWESGKLKRGQIYSRIQDKLGYEYHTAEIRSIEEARNIYRIVAEIHNSLLK